MDGFAASEPAQADPGRVRARMLGGARDQTPEVRELDAVAALFGPAIDGYRGTSADLVIDAYLRDLVDGVPGRWEVAETYVAISAGRRGLGRLLPGRRPRGLVQLPVRLDGLPCPRRRSGGPR